MSNSHAACQPLSLICLGWVKGSLVVKSEPALRGLLVKLLHPPLHQRSSWGLYPVLPQREGTGFSQGLILLSKWLYCIIHISEEKWTSTWPDHMPGKLNTALPTLVRHQTSLHEILRQYIIGGPWWRRAGQGWGECLSVHAWVCTMNNSSSQEKNSCNKYLLSAYCVLLGTYASSQDEAVNNRDTAPAPQGTNISIQPR